MTIIHVLSKSNFNIFVHVYSLIKDNRQLMQLLRSSTISHIYKEANRVVDWLIKHSLKFLDDILSYDYPLEEELCSLIYDYMDLSKSRHILVK